MSKHTYIEEQGAPKTARPAKPGWKCSHCQGNGKRRKATLAPISVELERTGVRRRASACEYLMNFPNKDDLLGYTVSTVIGVVFGLLSLGIGLLISWVFVGCP